MLKASSSSIRHHMGTTSTPSRPFRAGYAHVTEKSSYCDANAAANYKTVAYTVHSGGDMSQQNCMAQWSLATQHSQQRLNQPPIHQFCSGGRGAQGDGVPTSSHGQGSWRGQCSLPEFFSLQIFGLKWRIFVDSEVRNWCFLH